MIIAIGILNHIMRATITTTMSPTIIKQQNHLNQIDSMTSSIPEVIYAFHHAETCGCVYRIMNVFHAEVLKEKKEKEKEIEKEPFKREFYSDDVAFFY